MSADIDSTRSAAADAAAAPLDLLLGDAATGMMRRMNPGGSGLRLAASLAARPRLVVGRGTQLAGELARITVGRSQVQPSRRDRRFADPGWAGNPLLRRAMQAYLAAAQAAEGVVAEAGLDEKDAERVGFVLTNYHTVEGATKIFVQLPGGKGSYADIRAARRRCICERRG